MVIGYSQAKRPSGYRSFRSSLELIGNHYALRCDAKLADKEFREMEERIRQAPFRELGDFLPSPFVKGIQPKYLEEPTRDSVLVVNTLSIQNLSLNPDSCRLISRSTFDEIDDARKLTKGDVLLTVDGGVSIGKAVIFPFEEDMTIDSHIVVLRPEGIRPVSLQYLLASSLCQKQFRQAESGASGQTSVTEDDVRRFIVPSSLLEKIDQIASEIDVERCRIQTERDCLDHEEKALFARLST